MLFYLQKRSIRGAKNHISEYAFVQVFLLCMSKVFLILFSSFFLWGEAWGQSYIKKDTAEANVLIRKYYSMYNTQPDKALGFAREALKISETLNYSMGKAEASVAIGKYFQDRFVNVKGSMDTTNRYFQQALYIFRQEKEENKILSTLILLAQNNAIRKKYSDAAQQYKEALIIAEQANKQRAKEECYVGLVLVYEKMGDQKNALEYRIKEQSIQKTTNEEDEARLLMKLGNTCLEKGNCEKALMFYYESYRLFQKQYNKEYLKQSVMEKIEQAMKQCQTSKYKTNDTLTVYLESMEVYKTLGDTLRMIKTHRQIASWFLNAKKDPEKAIAYTKQSLLLSKRINNKEEEAFDYITLAKIYADLNNNKEALYNFQLSRKLYEVLANEYTVKQIAAMEASYQEERKQQALNVLEKDKEILSGQNKIQNMKLKEAIYQQEKKQQILMAVSKDKDLLSKKTELQELEITQQRYIIIGIIVVFMLMAALAVLIMRQLRLKSSYNQLEAEQKALRAQMNPHFIFNALVSIQNFIHGNNNTQAVSYLGKFAGLMRIILENSREELVTLESEIKVIDYYLSLERLRFDGKFDFTVSSPDSIDPESIYVPSMLLQPFVENSIVHGFRGINYKGKIEVSFTIKEEMLFCKILDNGIGIGIEKASNIKKESQTHKSLSTQIIEERISLYARKSGKKIQVEITNNPNQVTIAGGTAVLLIIPL
jgi:tetratricopeptide (TPR) repeat protein